MADRFGVGSAQHSRLMEVESAVVALLFWRKASWIESKYNAVVRRRCQLFYRGDWRNLLNQLRSELRTKDLEHQQRLARLQTVQTAVGSQGFEQEREEGQRPAASASVRLKAVQRAQLVVQEPTQSIQNAYKRAATCW